MTLGRLWAGRAYGTNTGNVFVELNGNDEALTGTLHLNEPGVGPAVYEVPPSIVAQAIVQLWRGHFITVQSWRVHLVLIVI